MDFKRVYLTGHSFGGATMVTALGRKNEVLPGCEFSRVKGLILIDPYCVPVRDDVYRGIERLLSRTPRYHFLKET